MPPSLLPRTLLIAPSPHQFLNPRIHYDIRNTGLLAKEGGLEFKVLLEGVESGLRDRGGGGESEPLGDFGGLGVGIGLGSESGDLGSEMGSDGVGAGDGTGGSGEGGRGGGSVDGGDGESVERLDEELDRVGGHGVVCDGGVAGEVEEGVAVKSSGDDSNGWEEHDLNWWVDFWMAG